MHPYLLKKNFILVKSGCYMSPCMAVARAALWRAHRRLNDGGDPELIEGKQSPSDGVLTATREPRSGGRERGAHRGRGLCGDARADGEAAPVRG
jgi:hypothetical protein